MKNIEVEIRSFISKSQHTELVKFLEINGKLIKDIQDETVYLGKESLRVRRDNNSAYIIAKAGKIHDKAREEIEIKINRSDFKKTIELFTNLGYEVVTYWNRLRKIYLWQETKVFLDYTKGYEYIIELEKITSKKNEKLAYAELEKKLLLLGIKSTSKENQDKRFQWYLKNWQKVVNYK